MRRKRTEARDLRSLERARMLEIFRPLDPGERPAVDAPQPGRRNTWVGPFTPNVDDPLWKGLLSLLWMPALAVFVSVEVWLSVPPVIGWAAVIAFCVAYAVFAWLIYRRR